MNADELPMFDLAHMGQNSFALTYEFQFVLGCTMFPNALH